MGFVEELVCALFEGEKLSDVDEWADKWVWTCFYVDPKDNSAVASAWKDWGVECRYDAPFVFLGVRGVYEGRQFDVVVMYRSDGAQIIRHVPFTIDSARLLVNWVLQRSEVEGAVVMGLALLKGSEDKYKVLGYGEVPPLG